MRKLLIAACALTLLPGVAAAQYARYPRGPIMRPGMLGPRAGRFGFEPAARFSAGPILHLGAHNAAVWRRGYWWHGWRGGRIGWWWFAAGYWYWYDAPIDPYPEAVADYAVPGASPVGQTLWYCDNPPGYYPEVRGCPTPWRPVTGRPGP